jgi:DNA-binding CsgD family transcriptional regulator
MEHEGRFRLPLSVLLLAIAAGSAVDILLDRPARWLTFHTVYEAGLLVGSLLTIAWLWHGWRHAERSGTELGRQLRQQLEEQAAWREDAERVLTGLGQAIDQQFTRWRFTPSEREIALLLLKGKSHKEIAALTDRSERTVRQHAAAAYGKAGLDGRAALSAFFLEGLRLPDPAAARTASNPG